MRCPTDAARTLQRSPSPRSGGNSHGAGSRPEAEVADFLLDRAYRETVEGPNPSAESSHLRTQCTPARSFSIRSATCSRGIAAGEDQDPRVAQLVDEPVKLAVPAALMMRIACFGAPYRRQRSDGLCSAVWAAAPKKLCQIPSSGILSCISHCDWQHQPL
jgi:hypothetical protein